MFYIRLGEHQENTAGRTPSKPQCWRLLKNPDSLAARIIKAKYYPHGSIMKAKLGSKPSFAWRSIYGARDLIEEGMMWRIGNGEAVQIWGDRWIPKPSTFTAYSAPNDIEPNAKVKELINSSTGWWDQSLLTAIFSKEEVEAINTIPLSSTDQPDVEIWRCTETGVFSVKSAYHLAKEIEGRQLPEGSTSRGKSDIWRILWALPIPNTEKKFMWRACQNLLPTKDNLLRRKVVQEPYCPICGLEPETVYHILWDCPSARDVWSECDRRFQKCALPGPEFLQVVEGIMERGGREALIPFSCLARKLWFRRNSVVHGGAFNHPTGLI
jgi:hypothetical protein